MDLSIVVGNPKPRSRTLAVAEAVAERAAAITGARIARTVDLCDHAGDLFRWPHEGLAELAEAVAASRYLVVASPTYKASYTGLLKAFLDRFPNNGLARTVAFPVMTGGSATHGMVIDTHLRPLLVELGASVPTRGLYFPTPHMDCIARIVDEWADENLTAANLTPPAPSAAFRPGSQVTA
ncbi:NADPH-dependent FMN reductase [Pseudonocardia sp. CNS-139]|nr:NADPH-dependent FMN reductase [Pseudonocardia sp. CNS-139]